MYSIAMAPDADAETVESPLDHVLVTRDGSLIQARHDTPEADLREAGFDLTDFGSAENFLGLLNAVGIDANEQYAKVDKSPDDPDRDYGMYVWANADLAIITGNNPLTGEYSDPDMRSPQKGYASYIGLSGDPEAVEDAFNRIKQRASHIKEADPDGRQFI